MNIHPEIRPILEVLKNIPLEEALTPNTLNILNDMGISYAQAIIALHQCYGIDPDYVADYIRENNVFPIQDLTDYAYEIMFYLGPYE